MLFRMELYYGWAVLAWWCWTKTQAQDACELEVTVNCRTLNGGIPCEELSPRDSNCIESIVWNVEITNESAISPLQVNRFDLTLSNGSTSSQTLMLLLSLPVNPILPGGATGMSPRRDINLCESSMTYSASIVAEAMTGASTCSAFADSSISFSSGGGSGTAPVMVPPPPPIVSPLPAPIASPLPAPIASPPPPVGSPPVAPPTDSCQVICAPGFVCSPTGTSCLRLNPAPISATTPVPVSTSLVDCTVLPTITCRLANNAACDTLVPRTDNCQERLFYTIELQNTGDVPLTPTEVNVVADGQTIGLLGSLPNGPITVGQTVTASTSTVINVCGVAAVEYSANLQFRALPPSGVVCRPQAPPPPVPVPQPTIPAPIAPPPTFAFVDCTVVPEIQCVLLNGESCDTIVSRNTDCSETFRYVLSVRNAGGAVLDVTTANINTDGMVSSFLASLGPNPIPVGEIATAAQDVIVDVCGNFQFSASVSVSVDPAEDGTFCQSALPMPTVINIGGPPPVPAPVAVPSPVMTTTTVVDCTILSTLESCTLADGSPCSSLQVSPNQCNVEVFFNVRVENAGSIELTVTDADFMSGLTMVEFESSIPVLNVGQVFMVAVPVMVNVCQGADISASIDVEAVPPPGYFCR